MPGKRSMKAKLIEGDGPLSRVPPLVVFAVVAAVFVLGVLVRGVPGALLLGLLAAGRRGAARGDLAGARSRRSGSAGCSSLGVLVAVAVSVVAGEIAPAPRMLNTVTTIRFSSPREDDVRRDFGCRLVPRS